LIRVVAALLCAGLTPGVAHAAQASRASNQDVRLILTVVDQSGGVIPGAIVTLTGLDDATRAAVAAPLATSPVGVSAFDRLMPGRYSIRAELSGFETGVLPNVQLRSGDNRRAIVLAVGTIENVVTVARDAQVAAADPRGAFRTILTREEINALSDDPAEMAQQLLDMAGGNTVFTIDGFSGAPLPPKAFMKSIHIVRDSFAAENHAQEFEQIAIITQPGIGKLAGTATARYRDGAMTGRSPFTQVKGPERSQTYQANVGGTIVQDKSSFAISTSRGWAFDTPNLYAALPNGTRAEALGLRRPTDTWNVVGLVDYALTRNHTLRGSFDVTGSDRGNLGVGAYDLAERAFSSSSRTGGLRLQENGPIGRRLFLDTRVQLQWASTDARATVEEPTIVVTDAFTSGGAQVRGGNHTRAFTFASDLDYIRGVHSFRVGVLFEGGRYAPDDGANYLGTYMFTSREAFAAGQPATYTRRIGEARVEYWNTRAGVYVQDDMRLGKSLTLSPGLRLESHNLVSHGWKLAPRLGGTWAPFKSGRTTVRSSYGVFYAWLNPATYEQTLRVDGVRQQELIMTRPSFPDPGPVGLFLSSNKYVLGKVALARTQAFTAGMDQVLTREISLALLFRETEWSGNLYGRNLNAPVAGARPDSRFANIIETSSGARMKGRQAVATLTLNLAGGSRTASQARFNWRRETIRFQYIWARFESDSEGAFAVPPSGSLATEWAPIAGDRRHRIAFSVNSQALRNLNATLSLAANSGTPYTITTGLDDNGDLIFNDRPAGVGRNTVRTPSQYTWSLNAAYTTQVASHRVVLTANATNLTNHANLSGFTGVMTSPFFRTATSVTNPRRIEFGLTFSF